MCHVTCQLQLSHVAHLEFTPLTNRLFMFVTFASMYFIFYSYKHPDDFEDNIGREGIFKFIMGFLSVTILCQWHFILYLI